MEKNLDLGMQYTEHLQQKVFHKIFIRQVLLFIRQVFIEHNFLNR